MLSKEQEDTTLSTNPNVVVSVTESLGNLVNVITDLENYLMAEINELKKEFDSDIQQLNKTTYEINRRMIRLSNRIFFEENDGILEEVPFVVVGTRPANLPPIRSISDINALSEEQLDLYMAGLGLSND